MTTFLEKLSILQLVWYAIARDLNHYFLFVIICARSQQNNSAQHDRLLLNCGYVWKGCFNVSSLEASLMKESSSPESS